MDLENYYHWLSMARKFSRRQDEAADLLQDCLLIAFQKDRLDLTLEQNRKWLTGVLKHRAAMIARSEARRKNREQSLAAARPTFSLNSEKATPLPQNSELLLRLTPASRKVVTLILSGLNSAEVCSALCISPAALRQRLTTVRKALNNLPEDLQHQALAAAQQRKRGHANDLSVGLIRQALYRLAREGYGIGTHDPDGHLLIIKSP